MSKKKYLENLSLFLQRYPKYTLFFSSEKKYFLLEEDINAEDSSELFYNFPREKFSLNATHEDTICVYGLDLNLSYNFLKKWLHKKRERDLIYVEDFNFLSLFLKTSLAKEMILDPQVHFYFQMKDQNQKELLDEIASDFPHKMTIIALKKKASLFLEFKQNLLRSNIYFSALQMEELYNCKNFPNFILNLQKLPLSFFLSALKDKFKNIPALICGAGPSLHGEKEIIRKMYDKALIIAGGSAITALSSLGLEAHMGVIIDPNYEEFLRMQKSLLVETPIIYTTRVHQKVFNTFNGPLGYFKSSFATKHEDFAEERLEIKGENLKSHSTEAFSVTAENIALANFLGCSPIILCGVDLAYSKNVRYSPGVCEKNEILYDSEPGNIILEKEDIHKNKVLTCMRWVMESNYISSYAKTFNVNIINSSSLGIGFKDIDYLSLAEVEKDLKPLDLKGYFHSLSFQNFFTISSLDVKKLIYEMKTSLRYCKKCSDTIFKELKLSKNKKNVKLQTPAMILALYELEKEIAYEHLLIRSKMALDKHILKHHKPEKNFTKKDHLKMSLDTWKNFSRIINEYLKAFSKN